MDELWKDIPGFEGRYQASSIGRIKSLLRWRGTSERVLKPTINRGGYQQLILCRDGKHFTCAVHQLVALTFLGACPPGQQVRHWDGVKTNCHVGNLLHGTPSENNKDTVRQGLNWLAARGRCSRGHLYTPENLRKDVPAGHRGCLACHRLTDARRWARHHEA